MAGHGFHWDYERGVGLIDFGDGLGRAHEKRGV